MEAKSKHKSFYETALGHYICNASDVIDSIFYDDDWSNVILWEPFGNWEVDDVKELVDNLYKDFIKVYERKIIIMSVYNNDYDPNMDYVNFPEKEIKKDIIEEIRDIINYWGSFIAFIQNQYIVLPNQKGNLVHIVWCVDKEYTTVRVFHEETYKNKNCRIENSVDQYNISNYELDINTLELLLKASEKWNAVNFAFNDISNDLLDL